MKYLKIILILFIVTGCGSKKKLAEKEKIEITQSENKTATEVTKTDIAIDSVGTTETETLKITKDNTLELTQADSEKIIIIEDENGKKLKITGANAIITSKEKLKKKNTTQQFEVKKVDQSETTKAETSTTKTKTKKETKKVSVKKTGLNIWVKIGIGLFLLLLIIIIVWRVYKKVFL